MSKTGRVRGAIVRRIFEIARQSGSVTCHEIPHSSNALLGQLCRAGRLRKIEAGHPPLTPSVYAISELGEL